MKLESIISITLIVLLSASCSAEPSGSPNVPIPDVPQTTDNPALPPSQPPQADKTPKRVCIMVWDAKQSKEVEKCRNMVVRKKYNGTAVPVNKK